MALLTALLDANVLYPAGLRDFLLTLADQHLYAPRRSVDIHAEWIRSVLADRPDLTVDMLERTSTAMDRHFPDSVVTGYSARAAHLDLPDPDDVHVLAAAIEAGTDTIVTRNTRSFVVSCQHGEGEASEKGNRRCPARRRGRGLDSDCHAVRASLGRNTVWRDQSLGMPDVDLVHTP